jgi:hypothetical protein
MQKIKLNDTDRKVLCYLSSVIARNDLWIASWELPHDVSIETAELYKIIKNLVAKKEPFKLMHVIEEIENSPSLLRNDIDWVKKIANWENVMEEWW